MSLGLLLITALVKYHGCRRFLASKVTTPYKYRAKLPIKMIRTQDWFNLL